MLPTLYVIVPPHKRHLVSRKYKFHPRGQALTVELVREGDPDPTDGRTWAGSPVICFSLHTAPGGKKGKVIRYVGTETFLKYANKDGGWFGLSHLADGHDYYLDPNVTKEVCAWLSEQLLLPHTPAPLVRPSLPRPEISPVTF